MAQEDDLMTDQDDAELTPVDQAEAVFALDAIHRILERTKDETVASILEDACFELSFLIDQADEAEEANDNDALAA